MSSLLVLLILISPCVSTTTRSASSQSGGGRFRRELVLQDIQPCDQSLCTYLVYVYPESAGPDAEQSIKAIAGDQFVELAQAETYSGMHVLAIVICTLLRFLRFPMFLILGGCMCEHVLLEICFC